MPNNGYDFAEEFKSIYMSKQKGAPSSIDENMRVQLQSYPPIGQVTPLQQDEVVFTAVLRTPQLQSPESWEVSLWHSADEGEWADLPLPTSEGTRSFQDLNPSPSDNTSLLYFASKLSFNRSIHFTLRFRHKGSQDWRWIRDEYGLNDGIITKSSAETDSDELSDLIPDLNTEWKVSSCVSQSPGTRLWSLETPIPSAKVDESTYRDVEIGTPWGSFLRWFCLVRLWSPWLAPRHGTTHLSLDKDAILCSFLGPNGSNLVFLAISGISNVLCEFRHTDAGGLMAHARADGLSEEKITVLVSEGAAFENAVAAVMYQARNLVSRTHQFDSNLTEELANLTSDLKPEWMENWFDGLGFCTWNALGQRLTEQKVFDAVDKLAEHNVHISSLIIDDNWQSIDYKGSSQFQYGWKEFEAEPEAFPKGLKNTVSHIRQTHPNIKHIAVWHALLGYWGGISPEGKLAKSYKTVEVDRKDAKRRDLPLGGKMLVVAKEDVSKFYNDFYTFLQGCGIDAVKTDAQFMIDTWVGADARRELIKTYLDAWTLSTLRHFGAKAISCMSQIPQALFYSLMPTNRPTILVRNSDDFFPEVPSSHPWHVWANAYNAIFMKHLNVLPDWDMFQTVHEYSGFHAAARCVSGGPIYITDVPGSHDMDLINQMTGMTPRGRTVIFRPSVLGRAIYPYMGYDDDSLLKVGSYHGASQTGTPILGVFNISARVLTELIPLSCFPGTVQSNEYVVRAHTSGKVSAPTKIDSPDSLITTSLPVRGYEIYCAFPLTSISSRKHGNILIASLGLLGKMTGAAAITASSVTTRENHRALLDTRVKAFGILGVYISSLPNMTIDGDFMVTIRDQPVPAHAVSISSVDTHVLEIDIGTAWKEMDLKPGWSNEVEVKVHFSI